MSHCLRMIPWINKIFSNILTENLGENNTIEIAGELIPEHPMLKKVLAGFNLGELLSLKLILHESKIIIYTRQYGISKMIDFLANNGSLKKEEIRKKVVQMLAPQINKAFPVKTQYKSDFNLLMRCLKFRKGIIEHLDENLLRDDDEKHIEHSIENVIMPWIMKDVITNICFGVMQGSNIDNISQEVLYLFRSCALKMIKMYILKYKPPIDLWVGVSLVATRLASITLSIDEECDLFIKDLEYTPLSYFWKNPNAKTIFNGIERQILNDTDFQPCGKIVSQNKQELNEVYTKLKRTHSL